MKAYTMRVITAVAIASIAVAIYVLRPGSSTAAMPSLEEFHARADVNKLPNHDIEDQSLIYPTATKR
jgi:hypothetical protein